MATSIRRGPQAAGGPDAIRAENRKRLEELLKLPENAVCADCPERGPRWASATLGTFICIKCSGIHRNLGVHISFVRSVNLDEWKQEHVEQMERWGNARARAYYEAEVPQGYARPSDWSNVQQMTRWIKDKYEYKRFLPRDGALPPEKQPSRAGAASPSPTPTNNEPSSSSSRERRPRDRPGAAGTQKPTTLAAPVAAAPAKAKVVDLLDFSEPDPPAPAPAQAQQQQQAAPVAATAGFDAFGTAAPLQAPLQHQQHQAAPTAVPPAAVPQQELTSAGKPKLTPDQLISMFMTPQPPASAAPTPAMQAPTATPWGAPMQPQQQPYGGGGYPPAMHPPHQQAAPRPPMGGMGMGGMPMPSSGYVPNPPQQPPAHGGGQHAVPGFAHNPYHAPQQHQQQPMMYGGQQPHQPQQGFGVGGGGFPAHAPQQHQQAHQQPFGAFPSHHHQQPHQQQQQQQGGFPSPFHPSNPFG